jgi:3-hydroxybutyryl-CoA dehydrogenase
MEIKTIGVIGAGQMGNGIAQVAAQAGYNVIMRDIDDKFVEKGMATINKGLDRLVSKERISAEDKEAILGRITTTLELQPLSEADIVIEAIIERLDLKLDLYKELDKLCGGDVIFASNTSSISITELAAATSRPDKFIGMHFMNPVPVMKLVEIIKGKSTSEDTTNLIVELSEKVGKTPIVVNDSPGFISNRLLLPMLNEAIFAYQEGVAEPKAIDGIMKIGMNHPMGPLELADLIGLDTCLAIMKVLHEGFKNDKYRPCPLLEEMVEAGKLGRKSGEGFYDYKR